MFIFAFNFILGAITTSALAQLPQSKILLSILVTLILVFFALRLKGHLPILAFFCGFLLTAICANNYLQNRPRIRLNKQLVIGSITSLPIVRDKCSSFVFKVMSVNGSKKNLVLKLFWRNPPTGLAIGDKWQLEVDILPVLSFANRGSFDYEKSYFAKNIHANANVRRSKLKKLLQRGDSPLARIRIYLYKHVNKILESHNFVGELLAITLGITHHIPKPHWQTLQVTGTAHLVSVSGLHVGLVFSLLHEIARMLWHLVLYRLRFIDRHIFTRVVGATAALSYALLAGFALPVKRALLMQGIVIVANSLSFKLSKPDILGIAALCCVIPYPPVVFGATFWLSFGACTLLLYASSKRVELKGYFGSNFVNSGYLALGIIPFTWFFFHQVAYSAQLANLLAVPFVSLIVAPLALIGLVCTPFEAVSRFCLCLADRLFGILWAYLQCLEKVQLPLYWVDSVTYLLLMSFGIIYLLAPKSMPGKSLALFCLLPAMFNTASKLPIGSVRCTFLDVGQGLAVVVRTRNSTLVYDTGPPLGKSDAGKQLLVPFLRAQGIKDIDLLLISHADSDHIGGAKSLTESIPTKEIMASIPQATNFPTAKACRGGTSWEWDGVQFTLLHPLDTSLSKKSNDNSCVLQVKTGLNKLLLAGDIGKKTESKLVSKYDKILASTVLQVPHHGSKSSSSDEFITAVAPKYAIISAGYANKYGHPDLGILARYQNKKIATLTTHATGSVSFTLSANDVSLPECYRLKQRSFWQRNLSIENYETRNQ